MVFISHVTDDATRCQPTLKEFGFVAIDNLSAEELKSKNLVSVSSHQTSNETEASHTKGSEGKLPRSRGRPKVITLLPPSSPSQQVGRPGKYTNWFADGLFPPILQAMRETRGNYTNCLKLLRARHKNGLTNKSPYSLLSRSTLASWFHPKTKRLLPHVAKYAENETPYNGRRRFSIFGSTNVVDGLKELVDKQREAGTYHVVTYFNFVSTFYMLMHLTIFQWSPYYLGSLLTAPFVQALFQGYLNTKAPPEYRHFRVSLSWTKRFLRDFCKMSFKRVTTTAKKLPADWEIQGLDTAYRIAHLCRIYGSPEELVVNTDQTGIFLVPNASKSYLVFILQLLRYKTLFFFVID